jgi:hypothetical protein
MPDIICEKPNVVTINYRRKQSDEDYGSCLWANFNFNCDTYTLSIQSGLTYQCQWVPTPNTESFMDLCKRIDIGYLLDKISDRTELDKETTFKNIVDSVQVDYGTPIAVEELYEILYNSDSLIEFIENAVTYLKFNLNDSRIEFKYILECVQMTYPQVALEIAYVFNEYIQPYIRENF